MAWTGEGGTHVFQGSAWEAVRRGTPLTPGWASFTHLQPLTSTEKKQELNKEFSLSETMRKLSPHVLDVNTPHPPCWNSSYGEYPKKKKEKKGNNKWGTAAVWLNHAQWAWSPLSTLLWFFSEVVELFSHYMEDKSKLYLLLLWHFHQKHGCSGNCFINPVY